METPKLLHTMTDDELRAGLDREGAAIRNPAYADYRRELERRASERQARWDRVLVIVGLVIAVAALVVSALRP